MTHSNLIAVALILGLASFCGHARAAHAGEPTARTDPADIPIEADRVYSFVDPNTRRITALVVADDRPAMTVSIDNTTQIVDVTASDDRVARVSIADLADAYAQGDAERRAAFLVSMQRAPAASARESDCDAHDCDALPENQPTAQLASIVRWAVDHVGSSRAIAQADENADKNAGDKRQARARFDTWESGAEAQNLLRSASDFWNLWH